MIRLLTVFPVHKHRQIKAETSKQPVQTLPADGAKVEQRVSRGTGPIGRKAPGKRSFAVSVKSNKTFVLQIK